VVSHSCVVGPRPTSWSDFLIDAAVIAGIGAGFLSCCHGSFLKNHRKHPELTNPAIQIVANSVNLYVPKRELGADLAG
jgi:hypothetical protein